MGQYRQTFNVNVGRRGAGDNKPAGSSSTGNTVLNIECRQGRTLVIRPNARPGRSTPVRLQKVANVERREEVRAVGADEEQPQNAQQRGKNVHNVPTK